jgi:hypothetical protein
MTVHDFSVDLAYSETPENAAFWEQVYFCMIPGFVKRIAVTGNTEAQRRGVDALVYLANDRILRIDEKLRRESYPDICLEYTSNSRTGAPGWVRKELNVDYIAYGIEPLQQAYLLDFILLRRAWEKNGEQWKREYKRVKAINQGYETYSVPVPVAVLLRAMNVASFVRLNAP